MRSARLVRRTLGVPTVIILKGGIVAPAHRIPSRAFDDGRGERTPLGCLHEPTEGCLVPRGGEVPTGVSHMCFSRAQLGTECLATLLLPARAADPHAEHCRHPPHTPPRRWIVRSVPATLWPLRSVGPSCSAPSPLSSSWLETGNPARSNL